MATNDTVPSQAHRTKIQEFYAGQTIFMTGASGLIGKLLVEKLLRSCYDLKKILILVRPKKGKSESERIKEIFSQSCFELLVKLKPNFLEKISCIPGDCLKPDLGLSPEDKATIVNEVTCVFHVAATTRFNDSLRNATYINVRATSDLVKMAKEMKNLKIFVHVSTAYCNCIYPQIKEIYYEPACTGKNLITMVNASDDCLLDIATPGFIGEYQNTYIFTKAVAEQVVCTEGKNLPVVIVRPAIVMPTYKEPVTGYTDSVYSAYGIIVGAALGIVRSARIDPAKVAEIVPADFVVNNIIAAAWDGAMGSVQKEIAATTRNAGDGTYVYNEVDVPIYNYVNTPGKKITWGKIEQIIYKHAWDYPSDKVVWYYFFKMRPNFYLHTLSAFFYETVPAYIVDFVLRVLGKEPMLVKGYQKIHNFSSVTAFFGLNQWDFDSRNVRSLLSKMEDEERALFNFDGDSMDWNEYMIRLIKGARKYILKDTPENERAGARKLKILTVCHYTLLLLFWVAVGFFVKFIFGLIMKY